ncbi:hypothetical protein FA95DRAFT_709141 [Auriscalpium vulgare]|uniref:Uncharacterized protein n=1 Tax=Auriscalpium vulgare TaxID=40419 RepID=A0ACB8RBB3_9AGAM|nr:hypothetical protein FA95DRAFT_709141 [Auriscalpium vulgare]
MLHRILMGRFRAMERCGSAWKELGIAGQRALVTMKHAIPAIPAAGNARALVSWDVPPLFAPSEGASVAHGNSDNKKPPAGIPGDLPTPSVPATFIPPSKSSPTRIRRDTFSESRESFYAASSNPPPALGGRAPSPPIASSQNPPLTPMARLPLLSPLFPPEAQPIAIRAEAAIGNNSGPPGAPRIPPAATGSALRLSGTDTPADVIPSSDAQPQQTPWPIQRPLSAVSEQPTPMSSEQPTTPATPSESVPSTPYAPARPPAKLPNSPAVPSPGKPQASLRSAFSRRLRDSRIWKKLRFKEEEKEATPGSTPAPVLPVPMPGSILFGGAPAATYPVFPVTPFASGAPVIPPQGYMPLPASAFGFPGQPYGVPLPGPGPPLSYRYGSAAYGAPSPFGGPSQFAPTPPQFAPLQFPYTPSQYAQTPQTYNSTNSQQSYNNRVNYYQVPPGYGTM